MNSEYQAFVFDFDGVLADSVEVKTEAFSRLFEDHGPEIQKQVVEHHRNNGGMTRAEKIQHYFDAFLGQPIDDSRLSKLCENFANLVVDNVVAAAEIPGARKFLETWHGKIPLFIDSATPDKEIVEIVERRGLADFFEEVLGSGKPKAQNLAYILDRYNIQAERCLFFGDAGSDYQAAIKCGVNFIGVLPGPDAPLLKVAPEIRWVSNFDV